MKRYYILGKEVRLYCIARRYYVALCTYIFIDDTVTNKQKAQANEESKTKQNETKIGNLRVIIDQEHEILSDKRMDRIN